MSQTEKMINRKVYENALKENKLLKNQLIEEKKKAYQEGYNQGRWDEANGLHRSGGNYQ